MRIGLIIYGRLDQRSGGYLYDRMLVEHLHRRGHRVVIISLPWRSYWRHLADNFSSALLRRLAALRVDVLLQDELNHPSLFLLNARLKKRVGYPIVSIIHLLRSTEAHPFPFSWLYRIVERRYLNSVDAFIYNSEDSRKRVGRLLARPRPHVVATPGGDRLHPRVTPAQVRARAQQSGPLRVVFLGNLIRRKAPHLLLEAAARLRGHVRLSLAGRADMEPAYVRSLHRYVAGHALQDDVKFLGHVDGSRLAKLLAGSQVLALPSVYEGFGIAYLEAMGFGLPAIGTRTGAANEIIRHGKNGFLISPGAINRLTDLLSRLHRNRRLLALLGVNALAGYKQQQGWQASMRKIENFLYNQLTPKTK